MNRKECSNCPSIIFSWMKKPPERSLPEKRRKLEAARAVPEAELIEMPPESDGEKKETNRGSKLQIVSCSLQTNIQIPSDQRSPVNVLKHLAGNEYLEKKLKILTTETY